MDALDRKAIDIFPGKIVRKDLTALMKRGANVPTYVLEYLLGMYCSTDDEEIINSGIEKIKKILSENYVKPDQSEYVKHKIKENGKYTVIDKITVSFEEAECKYIARFTNLDISPFEVEPDLVSHNEKLLIGGIWCIIRIGFEDPSKEEEEEEVDIFSSDRQKQRKAKKKKSKYDSPFHIETLKPIQMANLDLDEIINARQEFTKEEWVSLMLRSAGYEPEELDDKQKFHYLLRFVPFIQKNYNLVELGPRGTGKSHVYSELSPFSILMSSGQTTVSNMFYNMQARRVGLVGNWDCVAFDEVGGMKKAPVDFVQTMKNYMANGSFARGSESVGSDASIAFEGNTFKTVGEMLRTTNLFEPFPDSFNNDSAFFDRIHAYLPGWETPKLRSSLFTQHFGLISDCFSEFCHDMRKFDFTNSFGEYFELNRNFNTRDETAVRRTFSGLAKIIYPDEVMTKEEMRELLEYSIECRRRVKEQLRKMAPTEFSDVGLGYIDLETEQEFIIQLPEEADGTLIPPCFVNPGYVYAVGKSVEGKVGIYRLENKLLDSGTGKLSFKNVEGLGRSPKAVKESITAAFNYCGESYANIVSSRFNDYDYSLFFNDLQGKGASDELSVAEVVGLFSALAKRPVNPSTVVCGKVVMSGSMMPLSSDIGEIFVACANAGAKTILIPDECIDKYNALSDRIKNEVKAVFYKSPLDAAKKALGVDY